MGFFIRKRNQRKDERKVMNLARQSRNSKRRVRSIQVIPHYDKETSEFDNICYSVPFYLLFPINMQAD